MINIGIDDYKGGELAATHFLQKGHTNLGFAGPFTGIGGVISKRCEGFSDILLKNHLTLAEEHIYDLTKTTSEKMVETIVSAIFLHKNREQYCARNKQYREFN